MRTDPEIRAVLLPQLRGERPDALMVQEWGITTTGIRDDLYFSETLIADVASVGTDLVEAWEIKSPADSVARLSRQVPLYSNLFDRCTLVTSRSHMAHAARLLSGPLEWWGLTLAEGCRLEVARAAEPNPGPYSVAGLLWSSELATLARRLDVWASALNARRAHDETTWPGCRAARAPDRRHLLAAIAALPASTVAPMVCAFLRARVDWRSPDGTHARREARRRIRQEDAEREAKRREDAARWLAAAARPPVVG